MSIPQPIELTSIYIPMDQMLRVPSKDHHADLVRDIVLHGLLNPIDVMPVPPNWHHVTPYSYQVVAGFQRVFAYHRLLAAARIDFEKDPSQKTHDKIENYSHIPAILHPREEFVSMFGKGSADYEPKMRATRIGFGRSPVSGLTLHETWQRADGSAFSLMMDEKGEIVKSFVDRESYRTDPPFNPRAKK